MVLTSCITEIAAHCGSLSLALFLCPLHVSAATALHSLAVWAATRPRSMCCVKLIYLDRESEFGVDPLSFPVAEDRPRHGPLAAATSCSGEAHPAPAAALWKGRVLHFQWCAPRSTSCSPPPPSLLPQRRARRPALACHAPTRQPDDGAPRRRPPTRCAAAIRGRVTRRRRQSARRRRGERRPAGRPTRHSTLFPPHTARVLSAGWWRAPSRRGWWRAVMPAVVVLVVVVVVDWW